MAEASEAHRPVMLAEVLETLRPESTDLVVDGTFGLGGHSLSLVTHVEQGRLLGIERDPWILAQGRERLDRWARSAADRIELIHGSYADLEALLDARGLPGYDAGLLDLGVNSLQIDEGGRGFSRDDERLDLRFDPQEPMTADAATLLATWSAEDLADALFALGSERLSRPISRAIVRRRESGRPVETARELAALVAGVYQRKGIRRQRIHPVTRTMQALRMVVNDELGHLRRGLLAFMRRLNPGGRLAVITFHSGEARTVKRMMTEAVKGTSEELPQDFRFSWLARRPLMPPEIEVLENPRARSAQLRAVERIA